MGGFCVPVPQLLDDVAETWQRLDHTQGVEGHKRTGLSVALSGEDDWQITREARMFWDDIDMPTVRTEVLKEVREMVRSGALTWANVRSLIRHPAEKGEYGEGEEFEGEFAPGEKLWEDDEADAAEKDEQESALAALDLDEVPGDGGLAPCARRAMTKPRLRRPSGPSRGRSSWSRFAARLRSYACPPYSG